jgi:hypothetical protein
MNFQDEIQKIRLSPKFNVCLDGKTLLWNQYIEFVCKQVVLDGFWLEFGVATGYTTNVISQFCNKIYGFDWFYGLSEEWWNYKEGHFTTNGKLPIVNNNVELVVGIFEKTLPKFVSENILISNNPQISFIHIDCDLYSSTKTIFNNLLPFIKNGTIIAFDEIYNAPACSKHEMRALLETPLKYEYVAHTQHVQASIRITE